MVFLYFLARPDVLIGKKAMVFLIFPAGNRSGLGALLAVRHF